MAGPHLKESATGAAYTRMNDQCDTWRRLHMLEHDDKAGCELCEIGMDQFRGAVERGVLALLGVSWAQPEPCGVACAPDCDTWKVFPGGARPCSCEASAMPRHRAGAGPSGPPPEAP